MRKIYLAACLIYFWLFNSIILVSISLLLGIQLSEIHFYISIVITLIFYDKFVGEKIVYWDYIYIIFGAAIITLFFVEFASHLYIDVWDSNSYHKQAVGLLCYGWNPVYQSSWDFEAVAHTTQLFSPSLSWAEVYPKATWYFAAMLYKITGNIESGKIYTMISMLLLLAVSLDYFQEKKCSRIKCVLLSIFIAFNPIALSQFRSYYLDGFAGNLLIIIMLEMIIIEDEDYKKGKELNWQLLAISIIMACALKTSITMFNVIICGTYFTYKLVKNILSKTSILQNVSLFLFFFVSGLTGVVIVGFSPYITNICRYQNFSYKADELMEYLFPFRAGLVDCKSNFQAFFVSIFSKMDSGQYTTIKETIKIPFSIHPNELIHYSLADTIKGGMGIWFSGLFIIVVIVMICYLMACVKKKVIIKNIFALLIALVVFIAASITPLTYWHRYVGFMYIIPIVAVICLVGERTKKNQFLLCVILFIAYVNIAPWFAYTIKDIQKSVITESHLVGMKNKSKDGVQYEIALASDEFVGILYNLQDWNINYIYYDKLGNNSQQDITYTYYMYYRESEKKE